MIETARLVLRRFTEEDLDDLAVIFAKPEVFWFPEKRGISREETATMLRTRFIAPWEEQGFGHWAVIRKDDARLIGYEGLAIPRFLPEVLPAVEIGYRLDPDAWGMGYATEGGRACLEFGFRDRRIRSHHRDLPHRKCALGPRHGTFGDACGAGHSASRRWRDTSRVRDQSTGMARGTEVLTS